MKRFSILILTLCLCLTGCGKQTTEATAQIFAMDTVMDLTAYGENAAAALTDASREINRLERLLSRTIDTSEISQINAGGAVTVSEETASLLAQAQTYTAATDGAFDITIAPLVSLWGITTDSPHIPTQQEIDALLPLVGPEHLHLSGDTATLDDGCAIDLGGIAKGSGMIHPNMATMLVFITTDAAISSEMLQKAVSTDVQNTFNMISVDGDTSTNDMLSVMANGLAGNAEITAAGADFDAFAAALHTVTSHLSRAIARDGEGATKLLTCTVTGATDDATARVLARSVISSSLVKTAMFGSDANWGRVLCALGYSGAPFNPEAADVSFASSAGIVDVCSAGRALDFSEELAKKVLLEKEVSIIVTLHDGDADATAWGCDLSYEYVRINGDYRS